MATGNRTKVRRRARRSPVFSAWLAIQSKGRVCERWRSFANFYADVGKRPTWRHSLLRNDATGAFEPGNARWQIGPICRRRRSSARSPQKR
jgi:hypothetical protein